MCFMDTLLYNFILTSTMNILWKVPIFISPDCEVNNTVRFCVLHSLECSAVIAAGHVRRSRIASRLSVRPLASSVHQQQQQHWEMSDERCMVRAHQQTVSLLTATSVAQHGVASVHQLDNLVTHPTLNHSRPYKSCWRFLLPTAQPLYVAYTNDTIYMYSAYINVWLKV